MLPILSAKETDSIKRRLLERANTDYSEQQKIVDAVLEDVRKTGDRALFSYIACFDGFEASADNLMVTEEETDEAFGAVDPVLLEVMKEAAANIEEFHNHQKRENWFIRGSTGTTCPVQTV